ncbi:(2Fe-2S)-binding protein [Bradyrhizobium genosp. A]|uniref:(2Fe-2S)-binding protein n=1 Tax=Bradyrhizobium genosp. A TaxID=83626 RepID=UPI003CF1F73B
MIVCSCNFLSDHDVRRVINAADQHPCSAKQIYDCLGCRAECGRCARTINSIIDETIGACWDAHCVGCSHRRTRSDKPSATALRTAPTQFPGI